MKVLALLAVLLVGCAAQPAAQTAATPSGAPPADAKATADAEETGSMSEGEAALKAGDWARARQIFKDATARDPNDAKAWLGLGIAEQKLEHQREAIEAYLKSIAIKDGPKPHHNLGMLLAMAGKVDLAREEFQRAVAADPKYFPGWRALVHADLELGDLGDAAAAIGAARELAPDDPKLKELTRAFEALLKQQGISAEAMGHYAKGTLQAAQGKDDAAKAEYEATLKLAPHFGDCHYNLGVLVRRAGDLDRAEREYRAAISDYPESAKAMQADAQNNLADLLVARGKAQAEAESLVRAAIGVRGERASYLDTLARACDAEGKKDCAVEAFKKLLSSYDPLPPEVRKHAEERMRALK